MLRSDLANARAVTLDVVEGEAPKTGKRSVRVPASAKEAIVRRLAAEAPVLFPRQGESGKSRKPKIDRPGAIHAVMWLSPSAIPPSDPYSVTVRAPRKPYHSIVSGPTSS